MQINNIACIQLHKTPELFAPTTWSPEMSACIVHTWFLKANGKGQNCGEIYFSRRFVQIRERKNRNYLYQVNFTASFVDLCTRDSCWSAEDRWRQPYLFPVGGMHWQNGWERQTLLWKENEIGTEWPSRYDWSVNEQFVFFLPLKEWSAVASDPIKIFL